MLSLPQCAQVLKMQGRAGVRECSRANLSETARCGSAIAAGQSRRPAWSRL